MSDLFQYFDSAFIINLPERVDRLTLLNEELARIGWNIADSKLRIYSADHFTERAGFPSIGARGCFYSHLNCLRAALHDSAKRILIIEDDAVFCNAFSVLSPAISNKLKDIQWDLFYLAYEALDDPRDGDQLSNDGNLTLKLCAGRLATTACYAVNERVLPRLIAHLERLPNGMEGDHKFGPMPIDGALNVFREINPDVRCLIASPKLVSQRPSRSDITPRGFDRLRAFRPIITVLRNLKHHLHEGLLNS